MINSFDIDTLRSSDFGRHFAFIQIRSSKNTTFLWEMLN